LATALSLAGSAVARAGAALVARMPISGTGPSVADPSGIAHLASGRFAVVGADASLWEIDAQSGTSRRVVDLSGVVRHPSDVAWCAGRGTFLVTDDDEARLHELEASGARRATIDLAALGAEDPEGVACAADPDRLFVADGKARQVLELGPDGRLVERFGVHLPFESAEGIAWDPASDHLLLVSDDPPALVELTRNGSLVAIHDLFGLGAVHPRGIALVRAEGGDGTRIWLIDAGAEAASDARILELSIVRRPPGARLRTNLAGDVDGFGFEGDEPGFALGDLDHDGLLEPGERLPSARAWPDRRDPDDPPGTDAPVSLCEKSPLVVEHALELGGAEPAWGRLTLVVGGARALPGWRSVVSADGRVLGEVVPTRDDRLYAGTIGANVLELSPPALRALRDGRLRVEIAREAGTGCDDVMLDFSRLEVALAGATAPAPPARRSSAPALSGALDDRGGNSRLALLPDDVAVGTRVEVDGRLTESGDVLARQVEVKRAGAAPDEIEGVIDSVDAARRRLVVAGVAIALDPSASLTSDDGVAVDFDEVRAGRRAEIEGRFESGALRAHALEVEAPKPREREVELNGVISEVEPARAAFRALGLRIHVRSDTEVRLD
jgi:uncharacterized protein YjiK